MPSLFLPHEFNFSSLLLLFRRKFQRNRRRSDVDERTGVRSEGRRESERKRAGAVDPSAAPLERGGGAEATVSLKQ